MISIAVLKRIDGIDAEDAITINANEVSLTLSIGQAKYLLCKLCEILEPFREVKDHD